MQMYKVKLIIISGGFYSHVVVAYSLQNAIARALVAMRRKFSNYTVKNVVRCEAEFVCEVHEIAPDVLAALRAKPSKRGRKGAGGAK